jgi:uncharacterized SAM-binding protein YcdF (DUF218 family)
MLISLKTFLHTLLLPPGGMLLLAVIGLLLLAATGQRARRAGWTLLIVSLAGLWLLSTPAIANRLKHLAQGYPALDLTQPVDAQAIVILGGGEPLMHAPEYGGAPAPRQELLERVAYGAFIARRTSLPVLVSGGYNETLAMQASLARDFGVDTRWVESRSRDTFQNAAFSAEILKAAGISRIVLVTDGDHEWRAAHEFMSTGLAVVPAPAAVWTRGGRGYMSYVPNSTALDHSRQALYEIFGDLARRSMAALGVRRQAP